MMANEARRMMGEPPVPHEAQIRDVIGRVRARWRRVTLYQVTVRTALATSAVLLGALVLTHWTGRTALPLALTGLVALPLTVAAAFWGSRLLGDVPSDLRVARFVEERTESLDGRLVTAVDLLSSSQQTASSVLAGPMLADAADRARRIDLDAIVSPDVQRREGRRAAGAVLLLAAILIAGRGLVRQTVDAVMLTFFPAHVVLEVTPGNARVRAGSALVIEATLVGSRAPMTPQVQIAEDGKWRAVSMTAEPSGRFRLSLEPVTTPFQYRVVGGRLTTPTYGVAVVHPPRLVRIDVDYTFPAELGLAPRSERDGGDIYAPAGSEARLHVHTDRPVATARLAFGDGGTLALVPEAPDAWSATLKVVGDSAYRVGLADSDGVSGGGDTEYFIRVLADRPPEVRIVNPAVDRSVTRLEEIDVEAEANDDYGLERLELVYAVDGGAERVLSFNIPSRATSVDGRQTMYLEDLDVRPGDFVAYYVRARDVTRGKRSSEARSDLFFLAVRPFEQEFTLAQSQSMGGSDSGSIDELVNAQKQVVVATWKLDRRSRAAPGVQSEQDIRSVARIESDLRSRVERASRSFRGSTMRDPRRPRRGEFKAEAMPEEDSMTAAATAMAAAVVSLDALKTADALPREMEALNYLLRAQADVKRRQVAQQAAGNGGAGNSNYDLSALFDRELQRGQESSYEAQARAEQKDDPNAGALDQIRDLASRQDELLKRQQTLARQQLPADELKRQLEKLVRDQLALQQRAEELARQMSGSSRQANGAQSGSQQANARQANGQPPASRSDGQGREVGSRMHAVSEEMASAAGDLQRSTGRASASGGRALEKLRDLERQLQGSRLDERRRAGELTERLARAQQLRDRLDGTSREIEKLAQQAHGSRSSQKAPGESEQPGQQQASDGVLISAELNRLRNQYVRELQEAQDLVDVMRRDDPGFGPGFTFEGQGMTLSAPGTEAFKQDFAKWENLRRVATATLDRAESSLSKKLQAQEERDRLAVGVEDKAPFQYQDQVDSYFRALATKKKQ